MLQNRAFVELSRVLASGDSATLSSALPLVVRGAGIPSAAVYSIAGDEMVFAAADGVPLNLRAFLEELGFAASHDCLPRRALAQRRTVIDAGVFGERVTPAALTALEEAAWQSAIAVPILAGGAAVGVILAGARGGQMCGETVAFLEAMANLLGAALAKAPVKTAESTPPPQPGIACAGCVASLTESLAGLGREMASQHGLLRELCCRAGAPPEADALLGHVRAQDRAFRRLSEVILHLPAAGCAHGKRPTSMANVIDAAVLAARPALAGAHAEVEVAIAPACDFEGDPELMALALRHIVINAAEAFEVMVERQSTPSLRRCVRICVRTEGVNAAVHVEDSGPGVPHDVRARVFEPGVSTKGPGRGLGLAVARHVVESHGGWLELGMSELGGTRVSVFVPLRSRAMDELRRAPTLPQLQTLRPRRTPPRVVGG